MEVGDLLPEVQEERLVIAVDYGTTYTGVAVALTAGGRANLDRIVAIDAWGPGMVNHDKIPSVISYSKAIGPEWGASVNKKSVTMVHTKLQLEVSNTSGELDFVLQALEGMHNLDFDHIRNAGPLPAYTWKGPEDIVGDYLTRMFESLLKVERSFRAQMIRQTPVDIVVTIPAGWSYRAKNSTFRALIQAGFNKRTFPKLREMLLVSEPEAAAVFTARYLKELDPEPDDEIYNERLLRQDECFVVCDAGGGTVDTISYQVKQLRPTFEIEPVTGATSSKCGSVFIDIAFKSWLRDLLGEDNYLKLDPAQARGKIMSFDREGEQMRELMAAFNPWKRKFKKGHSDIRLTLPKPLHNLNLSNRVEGGQITITYNNMKSFFEPRIDEIIELIDGQLGQIEFLRRRCRNVFLVGGFAESQYLQESIEESLELRDGLQVKRPETSWTAVVRGAAILGIEKETSSSLCTMSACPRSYGISVNEPFSKALHDNKDRVANPINNTIMAKDQLRWLIKKGDLMLSNQPKMKREWFTISFQEHGPRDGAIPIYSFDYDKLPHRCGNALNELTKIHTLNYDLGDLPIQQFPSRQQPGQPLPFYDASLGLTMQLEPQQLLVELRWKNTVLCSATIEV